jgi:predicted KAP-like P-loop ATPase
MAKFNKNGDEPIATEKADKFGRIDFAKGLAEALIKVPNNESFTVGLHGTWGSGKTSIIKLAEEYIAAKHKDDVIVISFNPWLFSSAESLHTAFFGTLAQYLGERLSTKKERIFDELRAYGELTGAVGGAISVVVPFAGTAKLISPMLDKFFHKKSGSSVDDIKDRVNKILLESNKRIIVVIDDIDRLDSDEIHLVFKLVKNVAHFNNISYLLAFDQNVVAKALAGRYPEEPEIGGNFVEKIVQLPLIVPPVDPEVLSQFIIDQVNAITTKHKLDLTQDDIARFESEYSELLRRRFTTPRKAIRYLNAIDFTFERLANEANFTDVMLVEALRIFDQKLYERIAGKKSVLIDRGHYGNRDDNDKKTAKVEVFGTEAITSWQGSIIRELFPSYEWALGGSSYAGDYVKGWDNDQRVCSDKYFERYFNYGVPVGDVPDARLREFLTLAENPNAIQDEVSKALKKLVESGHPDVLVSKLRNKEDEFSKEVSEKLAYALVNVGSILPRPKQSMFGDTFSSYVQSSILAVSLTRKSSDTVKVLKNFMSTASLDYADQLMRWIRVGAENDEKKEDFVPLITEIQLKEIGELFAKRIKEYSDSNDLINNFNDDLPSLLWYWNNWGKKKDVEGYIKKAVAIDDKNANTFVTSYTGNSYEMGSGRKSRAEFRRESYNEIAKFIDPGVFIGPLKRLYGDDIDADLTEFPSGRFNKSESEDRLTARQFIYVHKVAILEHKNNASGT